MKKTVTKTNHNQFTKERNLKLLYNTLIKFINSTAFPDIFIVGFNTERKI